MGFLLSLLLFLEHHSLVMLMRLIVDRLANCFPQNGASQCVHAAAIVSAVDDLAPPHLSRRCRAHHLRGESLIVFKCSILPLPCLSHWTMGRRRVLLRHAAALATA